MPNFIPDPIYGTTELDDYIDGLLRLPQLAQEKWRLERIKSLGLIHISFPSATHSKWEHHLGMVHLASQISLNKENKRRLQILCLLGGIGHLPYTYATEEAVLLAARLSSEFRKTLEGAFAEVWEMARSTDNAAGAPYKEVINEMQVAGLHGWLSALKIKRFAQSIDLGDRKKIVRDRISNDSELSRLYRLVARVDYVQRDLYYTGLARFSLSAESLLRRYQNSIENLLFTPASNLIDQLRSYLTDSLYFEVRSATLEALFTKKIADLMVAGTIKLEQLLSWHDVDLDHHFRRAVGNAWWADVVEPRYTEICRAKVRHPYRVSINSPGIDTLNLESELVGLSGSVGRTLTSYPATRGLVVLCKNAFNPLDSRPSTDVVLSVGRQPDKITPTAEIIHRLQFRARDNWARSRSRVKRALAEDLLSYLLDSTVYASNSQVGVTLALGFSNLARRKKQNLLRHIEYRYVSSQDGDPGEPEFWEQMLLYRDATQFVVSEGKWLGELLRAAARDSKSDLSPVIETASWLAEHTRLQKDRVKWILPNVIVESDAGSNQIDVCSIRIRNRTTILRLIECTKSDSEDKAVDDLRKLEKIKSRCRSFTDLKIEQIVYGASSVREHFSPTQSLLDEFQIKGKK